MQPVKLCQCKRGSQPSVSNRAPGSVSPEPFWQSFPPILSLCLPPSFLSSHFHSHHLTISGGFCHFSYFITVRLADDNHHTVLCAEKLVPTPQSYLAPGQRNHYTLPLVREFGSQMHYEALEQFRVAPGNTFFFTEFLPFHNFCYTVRHSSIASPYEVINDFLMR